MAGPAAIPAADVTPPAAGYGAPAQVAFRERLLIAVLFVAVLASSFAFIEPSPHDLLMGMLGLAGLAAGIRFHRILLVPFLLLMIWNISGLATLTNVPREKTIQYAATSIYLAVAALLFAMIFANNTMARMAAMRRAYVLTAAIAALCGAAGYFHLFPGADKFTLYGRALGMFKDPNVYGPFLILPALFLLERMASHRIKANAILFTGIILFGLLLSFSRGAWFNFAVGLMTVIALDFLTAPTPKERMRILGLSLAGIALLATLLVVLLSIDSIGGMFMQRAQLIQSYDVGTGGRFRLQELAVNSVLNFPNGMGPFEFGRIHGLQQHNVYLQAFLVYGWAGGLSYILLLVSTLWVGFRYALVRTPWQGYSIAAIGAFLGLALEGFIIDTDHWRNFYLILGVVWGLAAATQNAKRHQPALAMPAPKAAATF
ncbi:MAG: O-antigen ligase domain-containing protein [Pseudolabrys sp.]|nr:O-antigen ligase domain-containing protein [Pseudolabrys sp.]